MLRVTDSGGLLWVRQGYAVGGYAAGGVTGTIERHQE